MTRQQPLTAHPMSKISAFLLLMLPLLAPALEAAPGPKPLTLSEVLGSSGPTDGGPGPNGLPGGVAGLPAATSAGFPGRLPGNGAISAGSIPSAPLISAMAGPGDRGGLGGRIDPMVLAQGGVLDNLAPGVGAFGGGALVTDLKSRAGLNGPLPPPPIAPMGDLPGSLFSGGGYVDLTTLGGPQLGISQLLLQTLQGDVTDFFKGLAGGTSLPLDLFTNTITSKWSEALTKFKYTPGLPGFLDFFIPGGNIIQDKLVKATCTIYPWSPVLPPPAKILKDSYCIKAGPMRPGGGPLGGPG